MITIFLTINLFEHFKAFIIHKNKIRYLLLSFMRIGDWPEFWKNNLLSNNFKNSWKMILFTTENLAISCDNDMEYILCYMIWVFLSPRIGWNPQIVQFINWANFKNKKTNSNQRRMLFDMFSCSKTTRNNKVTIATLRLIYKWDFWTTFLEILELIMCGNLL